MKRKYKSRKTEEGVIYDDVTPASEIKAAEKARRYLRCDWHTRLVVSNAPSGRRYDFQPGDIQEVAGEDIQFLLSKKREQSAGCCGGSGPSVLHLFSEV